MLAIGGTFHENTGNRADEDAQDLPHTGVEKHRLFTAEIAASRDLFELRDVLLRLATDNVNIIGSRGYVYSSKKLARLIHCEGLRQEPNLLPRTGGLRSKYLELSGIF